MAISFNEIPADNMFPLFATEFDPGAAAKGGAIPWKNLLIGQALPTASADNIGTLEPITSDAQADVLYGAGSQIALMCRAFRKSAPNMELWALAVKDSSLDSTAAAKATGSVTVSFPSGSTSASKSGVIALMIAGQSVDVNVTAGQTEALIAAAIANAINGIAQLPVTASNSSGVVTITAKNAGTCGESIDIRYNHEKGMKLPGNVQLAVDNMDDAGSDESYTAENVGNIISGVWFNAIAIGSSKNSNVKYIEDILKERWTATVQKLGECFYFVANANASKEEMIAEGNDRNSQVLNITGIAKSPTPGFVQAAATMGVCAVSALNDPAMPLTNVPVPGIVAPKMEDRLDNIHDNNLIMKAGVACLVAGNDGTVYLKRMVTTYKRNALDAEDKSYMQLEDCFTLSYLRYDWNNHMATKFPRAKLGKSDDEYGPDQVVVTEKTGLAEIKMKYKEWVRAGLVQNQKLFEENVICVRDPNDRNALQWLVPTTLMDKFFIGKTKIALQ